jgi:hypothetical protein
MCLSRPEEWSPKANHAGPDEAGMLQYLGLPHQTQALRQSGQGQLACKRA